MAGAIWQYALFFIVVCVLFWVMRKQRKARAWLLVLAGYLFYAHWNILFLVVLLWVSFLDFHLGRHLAKDIPNGRRKILLTVSLVSNLVLLIGIKYFHLLAAGQAAISEWLGFSSSTPEQNLALPIGVFLFLLQSLGYVIDVFRRRSPAIESLPDYLLFVSFFPRLFAGPMLRADQFLIQINKPPSLTADLRGTAIFLAISGLIKKVVFADYLAINLVDKVFDLPQLFSTTEVILAIYGYALQIYCTYSAYTDIALALGIFLGFSMPANFRFPYQAQNLREFWRRWFVTLSQWIRDYLYLPLGGSRPRWRILVYLNLIVVMLAVGLGNGISWPFVVWGLMHGLGLCVTRAFQTIRPGEKPQKAWRRALGIFLTFHFVVITWAVFRAYDLSIVGNIISILGEGIWGAPNLSLPVVIVLVLGVFGMWFPPGLYDQIRGLFLRIPLPLQLALAVLIVLLIFKVSTSAAIPFVYERF